MASLAARCPACITVFRVVPDQLRVSDGWVRCGRCAEVFNATETLIDLETGAPPLATRRSFGPEAREAEPVDVAGSATSDYTATSDAQSEALHEGPPHDDAIAYPQPGEPESEFEPQSETGPGLEFDLELHNRAAAQAYADDTEALPADPQAPTEPREPFASFTAEPEPEPDPPALAIGAAPLPPLSVAAQAAEPAEATEVIKPSFVRRAERAERWRRPGMRAALAVVATLGLLGLAAQALYEFRDTIAARSPQARALLAQACAQLGCRVDAVRAIDSLAVESSGLVRVEKSSVYKLSMALRNRAAFEVALPALDLTLSDAQGKLLARRVLRGADLGAARSALAAGGELTLQATLQAAFTGAPDAAVAGYTIELFYP